MKLLFITGNLEPGKDGVGDYTLMMALRCMQLHVNCCIIAINDVYIAEKSKKELINEISVLRIKSSNSWREKRELSEDFIKAFDPDTVSIQMVGYAYQSRGWIFGLGSFLKSLFKKSVRFEVNLHEAWLGFSLNHDWKAKFNGFIQRLALQSFLKALNPSVIHVGNNIYYSLLRSKGYSVEYLPLPSNIEVKKEPTFEWINSEIKAIEKDKMWIGLFFGSIQGNWDINSVLNKLLSINKKQKLYIISVGKQGFGNVIWDEMVEKFGDQIVFNKLGYKSNSEISELLSYSDFGIGTTPFSLLGKSGTTMAMIEHGLPIIVTRDELLYDFQIEKIEENYNGVIMWDKFKFMEDIKKSSILYERSTTIASIFIENLSANH